MALHITDPETDAAVRKLARLWGKSLTETVKASVEAQLGPARAASGLTAEERTRKLRDELAAMPDIDTRSIKEIRAAWE
jgi:hypothetical protein